MLILSTIALPLAAIGYSLVYLLGGGGFFGARGIEDHAYGPERRGQEHDFPDDHGRSED